MATYEDPRIYETAVAADQRRDVPYYENTTGTVISGGATGVLAWANSNRKAWGRKDVDGDLYYELEVTASGEITVRHATELGDDTTTVVTGLSPSTSYITLVPGVTVPLHSSLTVGHIARIYPGSFLLDNGTMFCPRGQAGDWIKYAYHNAGTAIDHLLVHIQVMRAPRFDNTSGSALADIRANVVNAIADTLAVTVSDGSVSGKKFTFTGSLYGTIHVDNVAAASTDNVIGSTNLVFDAGAAPGNTDTAVVYIDDLADVVELCPDSIGTPDEANLVTWNAVTGVRLPLSRPGFTDLRVPAGQTVYFWARVNPGASFGIGRGLAWMYGDIQRAA